MRTVQTLTLIATMLSAASGFAAEPANAPAGGGKLKIGVYESRAIAVAYAASKIHNNGLPSKMEEMKVAEAKGDKKKVEELKKWGKSRQMRMHMQGFSNAPVDDLLAAVKDKLPEVARKTGVAVITAKADYLADSVETVDVTDELVKLFEPNERTLKTVKELRKHPPIPLEQAAQIED